LPANDKAIAQILLEVPALPGPGVGQFLADVAGMGGEWATLALSSARDIIINRPPNRLVTLCDDDKFIGIEQSCQDRHSLLGRTHA